MADGFKKYFNGTTINGRANVAKATYATLAVFYLLYRVRRTKGAPTKEEVEEKDQCSCDVEKPELPVGYCDPYAESEQAEKDCAVCQEKIERCPRDEGCSHDPPSAPPSPPSNAGNGGASRRKCPCDDQHRHIETPKQTTHFRHHCHEAPQAQVDEVHPAREIIGHMQEAASRVLRNIIVAVLGDPKTPDSSSASSSGSSSSCIYENEENCGTHSAAAAAAAAAAATAGAAAAAAAETLESAGQMEDDCSEYCTENKLLHRRVPRTAPKSCVPTNTSGDTDMLPTMENSEHYAQSSQAQTQSQQPESQSQSLTQTQGQSQSQSQSRYRGFDDDFASEMLFDNFDE